MKKGTMVNLDVDLVAYFKEQRINLSGLSNELLRAWVNSKKNPESNQNLNQIKSIKSKTEIEKEIRIKANQIVRLELGSGITQENWDIFMKRYHEVYSLLKKGGTVNATSQ